ncbi:MAG: enoyl-CoA hydratase/isomerase family protein [Ignavibacteriaceae bacterium]
MIKYSLENNTALITLNRPEKRNALHPDLINQLKNKIAEIKDDKNVKVLIITGEGKSFCAGADLTYLNELKNFSVIENEKDSENLAELFLQIYKFPKPTIAAVNGEAIAGGCGLASACDFIIANESSKFGYSEVKIGFIPAIVSIFLIKKVGAGIGKHLLLTGEIISGKRAYEINLVNYLDNDVLGEAYKLSGLLKNNSDSSLSLTKKMINEISNLNIEEAINLCIRLNTISRSTEDFKNGLNNFLNKK